MDKRKKVDNAKIAQIRECLTKGDSVESISIRFNISNSHVYRIKNAMNRGQVKLKPSSLSSCMELIATGLPFRRVAWPELLFYYYDSDKQSKWFIKVNKTTGCEVIWYSLDLSFEDLMAKDWVVLTWDSVSHEKDTQLDVSNVKYK
jgi:hypothetical protein